MVSFDDGIDPESDEQDSSFKRVSIADVFSNPPEPQSYIWGERIPFDALTLLAAHGGTGKSLFAMQLAAHTSSGRSFLGLETEKIKTLFFSAEDSTNTIRRRYAAICGADGINPAEVESNLIVLDATDAPCLFHEVITTGVRKGEPTEHYAELKYLIETEGVGFLIVDNASDSFGANPIDRQAVTKFIRALVRLVRDAGGAVLLLSHVNKVTARNSNKQTDSEGYADSAAWHNAARSRLFLNVVGNNGNLSLEHVKNNYGKKQPPLKLAFRIDGSSLQAIDTEQNGESEANSAAANAMCRMWHREPILKMIHEFYMRGENISVSPNSPSTNVYSMLKTESTYPAGLIKAECLAVVRDCQREGLIISETYKKPDRHNAERWALTDKGLQFIGLPVPKAEQVMETSEEVAPEENIAEAENI
ncbi:AAA family ATPase [Nitrosomonas ureae]|uniref:AAA domain-containing protein n=1 Tax=Nitrosomonas ureae TaxID=44577 RepID=A0A1H9EBE1_9PROT|nr:AAA family ATPase [Nitrosomonas ureae]SEQ22593.1 AAA domain-containing protein [Nitrosomonas ureae]